MQMDLDNFKDEMNFWPSTTAVIISWQLGGGGKHPYCPLVEYKYTVKGKEYICTRYSPAGYRISGKEERDYRNLYKPGSVVKIFYNPNLFHEAYINLDKSNALRWSETFFLKKFPTISKCALLFVIFFGVIFCICKKMLT